MGFLVRTTPWNFPAEWLHVVLKFREGLIHPQDRGMMACYPQECPERCPWTLTVPANAVSLSNMAKADSMSRPELGDCHSMGGDVLDNVCDSHNSA